MTTSLTQTGIMPTCLLGLFFLFLLKCSPGCSMTILAIPTQNIDADLTAPVMYQRPPYAFPASPALRVNFPVGCDSIFHHLLKTICLYSMLEYALDHFILLSQLIFKYKPVYPHKIASIKIILIYLCAIVDADNNLP